MGQSTVEPVKKLLEYGEPVPEKVMGDMRSCGAAIIHVDAERTITDRDGNDHVLLNPERAHRNRGGNGHLWTALHSPSPRRCQVPSNLEGLFEVRYKGDTLDATATLNLLEAMKDIKNYALPSEPRDDEG